LLDAMVLVAATAPGLSLMREFLRIMGPRFDSTQLPSPPARFLGMLALGAMAISPCVADWSLAQVALAMRGPRPRRARLARRPGVVACAAGALVAIAFFPVLVAMAEAKMSNRGYPPIALSLYRAHLGLLTVTEIGTSVAACWLLMATLGLWRPTPDWIDRLGRILGVYWIAMIPVGFWLAISL